MIRETLPPTQGLKNNVLPALVRNVPGQEVDRQFFIGYQALESGPVNPVIGDSIVNSQKISDFMGAEKKEAPILGQRKRRRYRSRRYRRNFGQCFEAGAFVVGTEDQGGVAVGRQGQVDAASGIHGQGIDGYLPVVKDKRSGKTFVGLPMPGIPACLNRQV